MKRLLSILALCALALALTACGGGSNASSGGGSSGAAGSGGEVSFDAVYQGILDAQKDSGQEELIFFPEEGADAIESLYPGLSALNPSRVQLYLPPVTGYACEILLVEVAEGDVDAAKAILQDRIDSGANDTGYPENAVLWQNNAQVQVQGNCLCMIALPDGYTIPENVFALG